MPSAGDATRRAPLVWAAVVVPTWVVFVLCTHWEPILRDGWGHQHWHTVFDTTLSNVWTFAHDSYVHNNPRLGQVLTLLVYTPGPYHEIATPLIELGLFWLLTVLALGRLPSLARTDDALVFATILATVVLAAPQLGPMLFYRPFTGNYVFGLVICLALLAPYRVHAETPRPRGWWWIPIMLVVGVAAGMSNEHTGPAFAVLIVVAIALFVRRGESLPALWMIAGLVGLLAGGLALYYAPGQDIRYNGLANTSVVDRISERGLRGNARILFVLFAYVWRLVPWLVLGAVAWRTSAREPMSRPRKRSAVIAIATAFAISVTLLASPKQGPRLHFASVSLVCCALASVMVPMLRHRYTQLAGWLLAATALGYVGFSLVTTYHTVGTEFATRFDAIEHAPKHGVVTVTPYSVKQSRWFLGEDFGVDKLRFNLAWNRGLAGIVLDRSAEALTDDPGGL